MIARRDGGVLPNLFIPGAGKSGTTSLHEYLNHHEAIFMCPVKEPQFFSHDDRFALGGERYSALFADGTDAKWRGESSTTYMAFPNVIERISAIIDAPRFIFLLRNPIDRLESHYRWLWMNRQESRPFRRAFLADAGKDPDFRDDIRGNYRYYDSETRYGRHVERFIAAFGHRSVLVLTSEQLRDDHLQSLNRCAQFLEISPFGDMAPVWSNATPDKRAMRIEALGGGVAGRLRTLRGRRTEARSQATPRRQARAVREQTAVRLSEDDRRWLADVYADDVAKLRAITGERFGDWERDFPLPHETPQSV